MRKMIKLVSAVILGSILFTSCTKEEVITPIVVPTVTPIVVNDSAGKEPQIVQMTVRGYSNNPPQVTTYNTNGIILYSYAPNHTYIVELDAGEQLQVISTNQYAPFSQPTVDVFIGTKADTTSYGLWDLPLSHSYSSGNSEINYTYVNE